MKLKEWMLCCLTMLPLLSCGDRTEGMKAVLEDARERGFIVDTVIEANYYTPGTHRLTDSEAGVVCYLFAAKAIDCLPIADTRLELPQ